MPYPKHEIVTREGASTTIFLNYKLSEQKFVLSLISLVQDFPILNCLKLTRYEIIVEAFVSIVNKIT